MSNPRLKFSLLKILLLTLLHAHIALSAILAVDYGSEWMKASLVRPGVPFDVLLNRDSKRKIQSVVAWKNRDADRLFGGDAWNVVRELFMRSMGCLADASDFLYDLFLCGFILDFWICGYWDICFRCSLFDDW